MSKTPLEKKSTLTILSHIFGINSLLYGTDSGIILRIRANTDTRESNPQRHNKTCVCPAFVEK
jgi:hypothetical protein